MILLDTNAVSEVMKTAPMDAMVDWLNAQDSSTLFVSTVTIGEIEYGLRILPEGRKVPRAQVAIRAFHRPGFRYAHPFV